MRYLVSIIVDAPTIHSYNALEASVAFTDVTYKVGSTTLSLELAADSPAVSIVPLRESS